MLSLSTAADRRRLKALALCGAFAVLALGCTHKPPRRHRTTTTTASTSSTASTTTTTEPTTTSTSTTSTTMPAMGNPVNYELADFTIRITSGQIMTGVNTVTATNVGTAPHEVNFVRAPSAASLPRTPTGGVDFTQVPRPISSVCCGSRRGPRARACSPSPPAPTSCSATSGRPAPIPTSRGACSWSSPSRRRRRPVRHPAYGRDTSRRRCGAGTVALA
jgi:hypothetical protein